MRLKNKTAQATTEMAIFGTLILFAFGYLISYGQRLNEEQAVAMDTFRYAVQKAGTDNGFVSYTVMKNTRLYDLFGNFNQGQASAFQGSATVLWAKGEAGSHTYYQINKDIKELPLEVRNSIIHQETDYRGVNLKQEDSAAITNIQQATVNDRITTTLYTDTGTIIVEQCIDENGHYSESACSGGGFSRTKTWRTPW